MSDGDPDKKPESTGNQVKITPIHVMGYLVGSIATLLGTALSAFGFYGVVLMLFADDPIAASYGGALASVLPALGLPLLGAGVWLLRRLRA